MNISNTIVTNERYGGTRDASEGHNKNRNSRRNSKANDNGHNNSRGGHKRRQTQKFYVEKKFNRETAELNNNTFHVWNLIK